MSDEPAGNTPQVGDVLEISPALLKSNGLQPPRVTKVVPLRSEHSTLGTPTDLWDITLPGYLAFVKDGKYSGGAFHLRKISGEKFGIHVEFFPEFSKPGNEVVIRVSLS